MNPIPYGKQSISQEDIDEVVNVLQSDFLTQGPKVSEFEEAFAKHIGAKHAIAVSNGTTALHLSALALGTNSKSKVLTTSLTFVASANCIRYCDGEVDFADIDPETLLFDLNMVEDKLKTGAYSGIVAVDFSGYPIQMDQLKEIADRHGAWIINDACHALEGSYSDREGNKQKCGNSAYSDTAIFSFHPVKHITSGEGGMITTNDDRLADKIKLLRTHGIEKSPEKADINGGWFYEMTELGYNYRMTDIQAALGLSQLKKSVAFHQKRIKIASKYDQAFNGLNLIKHSGSESIEHGRHLYIIEVEKRRALYDFLKKNNIHTQIHYIPVHLQPYYAQFGWKHGDLPHTEKYYERCLSLPLYPDLTEDEQQYVIDKVTEFLS